MLKLSSLNLDPLILSWIRAFLTNRSQYTVVRGHRSSTTNVISGVPQGSVLGPLLFLIFINDLPSSVTSSIRLFADDCVVYRRICVSSDQLALQNDLNVIENWCSFWMMQLNISKCKFMQVSRRRSNINYTYSLQSNHLALAESYRYLGVLINSKLTWTDHIAQLTADASKTLGFIRRSLSCSPASVRKLAYETYVRSKLEYASPIWNPHQSYLIDSLEAIQNRAARFITSKYNFRTSVTAIKLSLSLNSLDLRRKIARLCLFHKLYFNFAYLHGSLLLPPIRTSRRLFNSLSVQNLKGSTNAFNKSFLPLTIDDWNRLPNAIANERNTLKFKTLLETHFTTAPS